MYGGGQQYNQNQGYAPQQQQQQQYQQQQQRQPNRQQVYNRGGIGTSGAASKLPPPSNLGSNSSYAGEKFSLFVGGLPDGLEDGWLERILGTAGPVLSLRRPSPPFAFVEYGDAESVLRCLEVVNGAVMIGKSGTSKALLVKADEKTRERLDLYEASREKNESLMEFTVRAKDDLESIIILMKSGETSATSTMLNDSNATTTTNGRERPASHLQDLEPEDLPVENRGIITSEIALFRESAAKRAAEKKRSEQEQEVRRNNTRSNNQVPNGPGGYKPQSYQESGSGWGTRGSVVDPQSYNKPVGFVAAGTSSETKVDAGPKLSDADNERARIDQAKRTAEAELRERERRLEARERTRISGVERARARERSISDQQDRERSSMRERLAFWDDAKEADKGREAFYNDRSRWRNQRRPFRAREMEADAQDRNIEVQQLAALHKESEDFLERQADMFAKITEGKMKANIGGLPTTGGGEEETAVKLSFGVVVPKIIPVPVRATVLGNGEDEDEGKKRRELIPLDYSDDEEEKEKKKKSSAKLSSAEKENEKAKILASIPTTKEELWNYKITWSALTEEIIVGNLASFINKTIVEYLGAEEDELLNAVFEHLRAHKSAEDLVDELEPVLDEEAPEFVLKVWKVLVYELGLVKAGL